MASPRKLSSNEVAALVSGLMGMDGSAGDHGPDVRPYAFGTNDTSLMGDYHALRMINERFCRIARSVFLQVLRVQPRISAFPPEVKSFDDYRSSQDNFVSLTISKIEELRGNMLMVLPPPFISMMTDAQYGGSIRHIRPARNEFTATELRVTENVAAQLNQSMQLAWRDLMRLTITAISQEDNMQFAAFVDGDDLVVICSFMLQLPDTDPVSFDVIYPLQVLKPISSQLRSRMQSDTVDDDRSWRERLERAILGIPLPVSARLCQPEIPLRQLVALKEGDVLPVTLGESIEVLVQGEPMFLAVPGTLGTQAALSITRTKSTI